MPESSTPDFEYSKESGLSWPETLSELPFPIYILAAETPHWHLAQGVRRGSGETVTDVTVTYLQYPSEDAGPQILSIESSVKARSADYWPFMPIYHNENFARRMMDYVHLSFPDADDVDLETPRFFDLVAKTVETEEYQTTSGLRFRVLCVDKAFPLSRAYAHINNVHLDVVVGSAGFSRLEFLPILDLLIPVRGNEDVLRRQVKNSGFKP